MDELFFYCFNKDEFTNIVKCEYCDRNVQCDIYASMIDELNEMSDEGEE